MAPARGIHYHLGTMTTATRHSQHRPWRHLVAGLLLACLTLAAVPALAYCCADRCHDAEPVSATPGHCDCSLSGVEPPVDALLVASDPLDAVVCTSRLAIPTDETATETREPGPDDAAPDPAPDRTVVLLI